MNEQEIKEQLKQEIKQEMKKSKRKKIIIFIIILIIAVGLFFVVRQSRISRTSPTEQSKIRVMTEEEFAQYTTEIPITTENWKNYFDYEYKKVEDKDAFGEIISTKYEPHLKLKDNIYGYAVLRIEINNNLYSDYEYKTTLIIGSNDTTLPIADFRLKSGATITMNDITCTKAKGNLYALNLPEDIWQIDETDGKRYFNIGTENSYTIYKEDNYINQLCQEEHFKQTNNN